MHGVGKTPPKVYSAYAQVYNRGVLFGWPMFPLSDVTDGERNGGSPAEHYSWFESGTEVAKDSRHSYRRQRSLGAGGSDRLGKVAGLWSNGLRARRGFLKSKRRRSVSCVIADVQMPGITGLELYQRLSASGKPVPTILITAYPDDGVRERALSTGVIGYLSKPFDDDDLLACVHSALTRA
jgi:CheY-like chemotaxis protein